MGPLEIVGSLFLAIGCVFALTGSVGVLRMPDFYSRLHPAGKTDTLAQGAILIGLALFAGQQLLNPDSGADTVGTIDIILKLLLLTALLFETAPTSTHAISKAARLDRHTRLQVDGDPENSRVSEIVVVGDVEDKLEEESRPVLDVHEGDAPEASTEASTDADEPSETEGDRA